MKRLVLISVVALGVAGCKRPTRAVPDAGTKPIAVSTAPVEIRKVPQFLTLTGGIFAERQSDIAANVAGKVTATYVERGQEVKQGQPIAVVDARAARFQELAAVAQSNSAKSQVALAKEECARADRLFAQGVLAKSEFDRQTTQCSAQLSNANAAQAQADLASKYAGDTVIRAPIDGFIGERFVNVGEYVQAATRVATVYAVNTVRVQVSVPEQAVGKVALGQKVEVGVAAYPKRLFPAAVRYVAPALRPSTRDLVIEAVAPNPDHALKPGMFATVNLIVGEFDAPTVPAGAIVKDGTVKRLFLAKEGAAYEMVVRTGVERDGRIAVLDEMQDGTPVIVNPPQGLRDGEPITAAAKELSERKE